ncbi:MAG: M1 family metallopeptidase, partial [Bacteroidota bacterium]|nr:M1 family metallopeptidase [Bacteroidota bacterium]
DAGPADIHEGIDIQSISVDGRTIQLKAPYYINNRALMVIQLPRKLTPGKTLEVQVKWSLPIAKKSTIRNGMYGDKNYFIAYWFPKIAVYDDIVGWDTHSYTGRYEFYNDFGNYNVEISAPSEYTVWANGILQNAEEIFTEKYYNRYQKAQKSSEAVSIIGEEDRAENAQIQKKGSSHQWKFTLDQTPDFAFSLSKSYYWDAAMTSNGENNVFVQSAYDPKSKNFYEVCDILTKMVPYYSEKIPGIPYPYSQITAFNGGGGMEFPGMVNDGEASTRNKTLYLTAHEVGHSYFPFATGLDEQKLAWIDEGLITFFPRYFSDKFSTSEKRTFFETMVANYVKEAGSFNDVPMIYPSENTGIYAYRNHAYNRPAVAYYMLVQELGEETFFKGIQLFFKRWEGKHPKAFDFFNTMNEVSGQDLAWFWKPWFFELGTADMALGIPESGKLKVHKKGELPVPVRLKLYHDDGSTEEIFIKAQRWTETDSNFIEINLPKGNFKKIETDTKHIPDMNPDDNALIFE